MQSTFLQNIPILQFDNLLVFKNILHFVSTRAGGVSHIHPDLKSLNFSFSVSDNDEDVLQNRELMRNALKAKKMLIPRLNHGINVEIINAQNQSQTFENTDALITQEKGICIAITMADCVPILLYDAHQKVCAAVHAGWRGTVHKIVQHCIQKMKTEFGTKVSDVYAGIGVSICPQCYEVGEEVIENVKANFEQSATFLFPSAKPSKAHFDLWKCNEFQLLEMGILPAHIEIAKLCSHCQPDLFFSARRMHGKGGRMAAGIMLVEGL